MPRRPNSKIVSEVEETESITISSTPKKGRTTVKAELANEYAETVQPSPAKARSKRTQANVQLDDKNFISEKESTSDLKSSRVKAKAAPEKTKEAKQRPRKRTAAADDDEDPDEKKANVTAKKRKTKAEKESEAMPLAARIAVKSLKHAMHIGAHVSAAGGVHNSINNALHVGGNSFALFLKSQRKWSSPSLAPEARDQFKAFCLEHNYDASKHVLPHGSYLVNLAQADPDKAEQAYECFLDDLNRCDALGIRLYNFHPGNTGSNPRPEAIARIATQLNKAHKATENVVTVLENMAGSGNVIGSTWEDLRDIIALIEDKSRVGVCIDTCHAFAAGYDLRSPEAFTQTMDSFGSVVGLSYLRALHLNDSKAPFSSHRDLHANIGTGFLGLRAFHNVMNYLPFQGLPMVLETPIDKKEPGGKAVEDKGVWATEIKLLESLIGADVKSENFKNEEQRLQDIGAEEREKHQIQADKKQQKTLDAMFKKKASPKKKGKVKRGDTPEDSDASDGGCSHS